MKTDKVTKKKSYAKPVVKAISMMPVRLLEGSTVAVDPSEEGNQNNAESLDLDFE